MNVIKALRTSKARIETLGWSQNTSEACSGTKCCAITAIVQNNDLTSEERERACAILMKVLGREDIAAWNDAPERTLEDVLLVYDKAIAVAEALKSTHWHWINCS